MFEPRWPPAPGGREQYLVNAALISGRWTGDRYTRTAEELLCQVTGAPWAVAFTSCTAALHAALAAMGADSPAKIIAVPALTFAGTVTGAGHTRARLRFTDIDPDTLTMRHPGPAHIYLGVDLHGVPWQALDRIDTRAQCLTDSCQALGTTTAGRPLGITGTRAWSFSSSKIVAAPDGGAVTTSDGHLAAVLRELRDYGTTDLDRPRANRQVTRRLGHNWRPSELTMALVTAGLEQLPARLGQLAYNTGLIHACLDEHGIWRQQAPPGTAPAWHKIRVRTRKGLEAALHRAGVPTHRWGTTPLHRHPAYLPARGSPPKLPAAEDAAAHTFCIGSEDCPPWAWSEDEVHVITTAISKWALETTR